MLKRKIEKDLLNWKNTKSKEVLLIKGARQVGKTFIVDKFGKENYENYLYVNFITKKSAKEIFNGDLDASTIYKNITLIYENVKLIPKKTLIFFDEIQECPNARTALKFLAEDDKYDIIASGSLLGLINKKVESYPVGYEKQIIMHSLDFEEFLWANDVNDTLIRELKTYFLEKKQAPDILNNKMLSYLKDYIVIGGMPEVVNCFINEKNYNKVNEIQHKILDDYYNDITNYAEGSEKIKIRNSYLSIPLQLAKENKKFMFNIIEKNARNRKYINSLDWLRDAYLVTFCYNIKTPTFPLDTYIISDQFKLYLNDIGLLVAMYPYEIKEAIINDTLTGDAKGGIYENLIADFLIKKNKKLYYYKVNNTTLEIEFLIYDKTDVIPIEIKAKNGHTHSLDTYINKYNPSTAYKLINGNIGYKDKKYVLPHYMAMFIA